MENVSQTFTRQFQKLQAKISSLFNKLKKHTEKLKEYDDIISSHIAEDIVEVAENISVPGKCHCLPHHPAYKESSASAETRIVYDVSSKRKGPSLNDCL